MAHKCQVVPVGHGYEVEGPVNTLPCGELLTENDISIGIRVQSSNQSGSRTGAVMGFVQSNGDTDGESRGVPRAHALIKWDVGTQEKYNIIREPKGLYCVGFWLTFVVIAVVVVITLAVKG